MVEDFVRPAIHAGNQTAVDTGVCLCRDDVPGFVFRPHAPAEPLGCRLIRMDLDAEHLSSIEILDQQREPTLAELRLSEQLRSPFCGESAQRFPLGLLTRPGHRLVAFQIRDLPGLTDGPVTGK